MSTYVITDGKDNYICKDQFTGKFVPIKGLKYATQWDNSVKVNNVLKNCLSKEMRDSCFIETIEPKKITEKDKVNFQKQICAEPIIDDNIDSLIEKIDSIKNAFTDINNRGNVLSENLSIVDRKISDIQHYMEFGKFNAYQGWLCFKMLQNLLRQRRKFKDELNVLSLIKECKINPDSISDLHKTILDMKNRTYTPRELPELFNYNR